MNPYSKTVAIAIGRFTCVTKEHQKLLDKLFSTTADHHHVYVLGAQNPDDISNRNPLTNREKVDLLHFLYPYRQYGTFIEGKSGIPCTLNAMGCFIDVYYRYALFDIDLKVIAGSGEQGVVGDPGGSSDDYWTILERYNGEFFPGTTKYRFKFSSYECIDNPRGIVSASLVREKALTVDTEDEAQVINFIDEFLHSNYKTRLLVAKSVIKKIQERYRP